MGDILVNYDENDDILIHHGIKGQEWYKRRYQNADGSYTLAGKLRRRKSFRLETKDERAERLAKKKERKAVQQVKKAEKAAKREEKQKIKSAEEAAALERKKMQILRSGDADRIYKNQHLFTDQEMNTALNRLRMNEQVRTMGKDYKREVERAAKAQQASQKKENASQKQSDKQKNQNQQQNKQQVKNGQDIVDKLWKAGKTAVGVYGTYNALAKAVNSITGEETLPNFSSSSLKGWAKGRKEAKVDKDIERMAKDIEDRNRKENKTGPVVEQVFSVEGEGTSRKKSSKSTTTSFTRPDSDIIDMVFDAATGSYSSSGYSWSSAMDTPIKDLLR